MLRATLLFTLALASALSSARAARAQATCLSQTDVRAMLARVNSAQASPPAPSNAKLRETLLKLREESLKSFRDSYPEAAKEDELLKRLRASREKNSAHLCPILKEFGWPASEAVGRVGVVSPLTGDRQTLLQSVEKIEGNGGSNVWDALKFTLDEVVGPKTLERRRAVVMLTDGVDGALMGRAGRGSRTLFSELLETVRRTDALVVPIYLDTEGDDALSRRLYGSARRTLSMLADESGGLYYKAKKLEDLDGVYAQVIEDLGKVYSLGYKPTNDRRDGLWREVKVQIRDRPDLSARARPGYCAK